MPTIVFVLVFRSLIQDVGPVTTYTDYPTMAACDKARIERMFAVGDRMIHAHCEPKEVR